MQRSEIDTFRYTHGTTLENVKNTMKHHTQESQEVRPFPAGDHNAAMNRPESITSMIFT